MRTRYLVTATVLLSAVYTFAQSTGRQSAYPNSTTSSNQKPSSPMAPVASTQPSTANKHDSLLEGCIGGSSDRLTLIDAAGQVYQLRGDKAKISGHNGQQASIGGLEAGERAG